MTIAALYVERGGPYFGLPDVDPWDKERDARLYAGPHPVVAHPPCHLWVNFAALNFKRYGGERNRPGNDGGCFASALHNVRTWGGRSRTSRRVASVVDLRHPGSAAWSMASLRIARAVLDSRQLRHRGLAVGLWASRSETDMAALQRFDAAERDALGEAGRHASGRLVRSHQADAEQARGECDADGVSGCADRSGEAITRGRAA